MQTSRVRSCSRSRGLTSCPRRFFSAGPTRLLSIVMASILVTQERRGSMEVMAPGGWVPVANNQVFKYRNPRFPFCLSAWEGTRQHMIYQLNQGVGQSVCVSPRRSTCTRENAIIGFCGDGIRSLGSRCFFSYCIFGVRQSRHAGAHPLAEFTENAVSGAAAPCPRYPMCKLRNLKTDASKSDSGISYLPCCQSLPILVSLPFHSTPPLPPPIRKSRVPVYQIICTMVHSFRLCCANFFW